MAKLFIIFEDLPAVPGKTGIRITGAVQDHEAGKPDTEAIKMGKATLEAVQAATRGSGFEGTNRDIDEASSKRTEDLIRKALSDSNGATPVRPKVRAPMRRAPRGRRT